ncbi:MAG: D-sedoheptulose 7-phosphate isomerase [Armatimonadetes bacterium]|nr:D-sedoheptulose 7-phosphate isomerase [Armatimonadota bacterium]
MRSHYSVRARTGNPPRPAFLIGRRDPSAPEQESRGGGGKLQGQSVGRCDLTDYQRLIRASIEESREVKERLLQLGSHIERAGQLLVRTLSNGGRIFFFGNGGSAADSQHLAAELVGRFEEENCLPAMALTTDTSVLLAIANDFSSEEIFSRQVRALVRPGDAVVAISTSGNSPNVLRGAEAARSQGASVIGLAGRDGGKLAGVCDVVIIVPSDRVCRIQEGHITVGHILCEIVEEARRRGELLCPSVQAGVGG